MTDAMARERSKRQYDLIGPAGDCSAWHGAPQRSLIICTQPRSGSTLLGEAIFHSGTLGCPLEYFSDGFRPAFGTRWKSNDFADYVRALYRHRTDPSGVLSVKLFWQDVVGLAREFAPEEFANLSPGGPTRISPQVHRRLFTAISQFMPNPSFVFLRRQDQIRQAISAFKASRSHGWRKFSDRLSPAETHQVKYDFDLIIRILAEIQNCTAHWLDFFRVNGLQYHELCYEDIARDYDGTLRKLFDALGRPDAPIPPPRLRKQADAETEALVQRFMDDFRQRARG